MTFVLARGNLPCGSKLCLITGGITRPPGVPVFIRRNFSAGRIRVQQKSRTQNGSQRSISRRE
jgi:hypothetical protein